MSVYEERGVIRDAFVPGLTLISTSKTAILASYILLLGRHDYAKSGDHGVNGSA